MSENSQKLRELLWQSLVPDGCPIETRDERCSLGLDHLKFLQSRYQAAQAEKNDQETMMSWSLGLLTWQLLSVEVAGWLSAEPLPVDEEKYGSFERIALSAILKLQRERTPPTHRDAFEALPVLIPTWLVDELIYSLDALDQGEVQPLVEPRLTGRNRYSYSQDRYRVEALCRVEFFVGEGDTRGRAETRVAKAMGHGPETLRDWRKQLAQRQAGFQDKLSAARAAGKISVAVRDDPNALKGGSFDAHALHTYRVLSADPLSDFGTRYRAFVAQLVEIST